MPRLVVPLLLALLCAPLDALCRELDPNRTGAALELVSPHRPGTEVAEGWVLDAVRVAPSELLLELRSGSLPPVTLAVRPDAAHGTVVEVRPDEQALPPGAEEAVAALRSVLLARADAAFWDSVSKQPPAPVDDRGPGGLAWALTLLAFVGVGLLDGGRRSSFRLAVFAVALAALPLLAWWVGERQRALAWDALLVGAEHRLVQLSLAVALGACLLALVSSLAKARRELSTSLVAWIDAGAVLFWSLFVRLELTAPNLLTEGGGGWARLVEFQHGFGALSVIVELVRPDLSVPSTLVVPTVLAALGAPALALTARALGLSRWAGLLSGLALASWPLHAALSSSDLLVEPLVALLVASVGLVAAALPRESTALFAAGTSLAGFALWGSPELLVVALPLAVLSWQFPRTFWLRPGAAGSVVWLGGLALVRIALVDHPVTSSAGPWLGLPWGDWFGAQSVLPWWLWLPVPLGFAVASSRARKVALTGLVAGFIPVHLTPILDDATGTYLEFFVASAFAWPFVVLLAGTGLAAAARFVRLALSRVVPSAAVRGTIAASTPYVLLALAVLVTPLAHRDYLERRYAPMTDEQLFAHALKEAGRDCVIVVPDHGERNVERRFGDLASHLAEDRAPEVVGLSRLLASVPEGEVPDARQLASDPAGVRADCVYFFEGTACHENAACDKARDRWIWRPLWIRSVDWQSHRLVSRPGHEGLSAPALQVRASVLEGKRTPMPEGWDEPRQGIGPLDLHGH